ncbi:MAG: hypothetical protein IT385_00560 [Deltaproteobacteria bacterium]|nr:hypothetical protein [Deltaproteobacteria bacterium]
MSAIVGLFALDGRALGPEALPALEAMRRALVHRVPSTYRAAGDGPCHMLIDPAHDPAAPMVGATDGIAVDDAITLVDRDGDPVRESSGHFACALYDRRRSRLMLARDALGARPLFWARVTTAGGPTLAFASELKALLAHPDCPRALDWTTALAHEAMPRRTFAPTSYFRGIEVLPPGGRLVVDARGRVEVTRFDVLADIDPHALDADRRSADDVIAELRATLVAAVTDALGPDPERAGLMLSGGIDSIAVAAIAARVVGAPIPTFTVLGQSTWGNGDARRAHEAASALGLPAHAIVFERDAPMSPADWRRLVWLAESPACGPQHLYKLHLARHAADLRPDVRRLLHGEGSDELMGADFRNHGEERPDATWHDYLLDLADKQRVDLHTVETLGVESWLGRPVQSRAALARASGRPLPADPWARRWAYGLPALAQSTLWRDDRLAAGCGMRAHAPYLDRRVVDLALRVPPRLRGPLFWQKRLLRDAMIGLVPEPLRAAPKTGFFMGVDAAATTRLLFAMLMADDRALVREALHDGDHPELAPGLVELLVAECEADPRRGAAPVLLTLVNLGLLEAMARDAAARPGPVTEIAPRPALGAWDEATVETALGGARPTIDAAAVLALGPGVELVRKDQADVATPTWYVLVDDVARFVLDDEETRAWCEVLRRVDGRRALGDLLAEVGVGLADMVKHIDEAREAGVVVVV